MNSLQILQVLQLTDARTYGVFPADQIPRRWTKPAAIIANTDGHRQPGSHWVAMYVGSSGRATYFDSYGLPPLVPQHLLRLRGNCSFYRWNTKRLQSATSNVCGQYCIMFLHYMCRNYSLSDFNNIFTTDLERNDNIVRRFYKKLLEKYKLKKRQSSWKNRRISGGKYCKQNNSLVSCTQTASSKLATLFLL